MRIVFRFVAADCGGHSYRGKQVTCLAALAALFCLAPTVRKCSRRLAQASGAETVLKPGLGQGQAVRFASTPAIGGKSAFERHPASCTVDTARGGCGCHPMSLRETLAKARLSHNGGESVVWPTNDIPMDH